MLCACAVETVARDTCTRTGIRRYTGHVGSASSTSAAAPLGSPPTLSPSGRQAVHDGSVTDVEPAVVMDLMAAADQYQLDHLKRLCGSLLQVRNACPLYHAHWHAMR